MNNFYNILAYIAVTIIISSCATIINSTGTVVQNNKFNQIKIICITPPELLKFSNKLSKNLKTNLITSEIDVSIKVVSELIPSLEQKSDLDSNSSKSSVIM